MTPKISVILAFGHPLVALGVRTALAPGANVHIVAECSSLAGTVRALKRHQPHVLLVGTGICEGVLTSLESLASPSPDTRIVLFCTHFGDLPEHALMAGASAVLPPETTSEQLIESVQAVAAGRRWRARHDTEATRKRAARRTPAHPALALLSVRERQIAQGIAVGKRNREIAEAYGISPGTVKLHLNKIYGKLGVNSRLALYRKLAAAGGLSD